jgi:hypothetical protein
MCAAFGGKWSTCHCRFFGQILHVSAEFQQRFATSNNNNNQLLALASNKSQQPTIQTATNQTAKTANSKQQTAHLVP